MDNQDKRHMFDEPRNVKRAIWALFAVCALSFVAEVFVDRHGGPPWGGGVNFYSVYGFVACVLLVLAAKEMRKLLMRKEDHYDD